MTTEEDSLHGVDLNGIHILMDEEHFRKYRIKTEKLTDLFPSSFEYGGKKILF